MAGAANLRDVAAGARSRHPMPAALKRTEVAFLDRLLQAEGFALFDTERDAALFWPGAVEYLPPAASAIR